MLERELVRAGDHRILYGSNRDTFQTSPHPRQRQYVASEIDLLVVET